MKQCQMCLCVLISFFLLALASGCAREPDVTSGQESSQINNNDFQSIFVTLNGPFRLENEKGEFLDYADKEVSGTMEHWNTEYMEGGPLLFLQVPATAALTFTPQRDKASISVSGNGQRGYVNGTGITSVVIESGHVSLEGNSMDFRLFHHPTNDSTLPGVHLEAHAEERVIMTASATDFTVTGISGAYTLKTMYSTNDILTKEEGFAEPGEVISQPIRGR